MNRLKRSICFAVIWSILGISPILAQVNTDKRSDLDAASKLFGQGQYKEARKRLLIIYKSPKHSSEQRSKAGYLIGESLERVSEYKKAMEWYESFLKDHPKSRNAVHARARLKSLKKNEGRFEKIILGEKAWDLYTAGKFAETLEILQSLNLPKTVAETKTKPVTEDDIQFLIITGHCLRELEFYQESADAYEIAVTLDSYDAEEFRDRSLRYITRLRIYWGSLASLIILSIVFLAAKPWRISDKELAKKLSVTGLSWAMAGLSLWLVGTNMEISEDVEKPIFGSDLVLMTALLFLPILATMIYATAIRQSKRSLVFLKTPLFGLLSCLATMGVILHFKDWFMLISL